MEDRVAFVFCGPVSTGFPRRKSAFVLSRGAFFNSRKQARWTLCAARRWRWTSALSSPSSAIPSPPPADASPITFEVRGLKCGSCVARCEAAILKSVPGADVAVQLATRTAVVFVPAWRREQTVRLVAEALSAAGFEARRVRRGRASWSDAEDHVSPAQVALGIGLFAISTLAQNLCCGPVTLAIPHAFFHAASACVLVLYTLLPLRSMFVGGVRQLMSGSFSMGSLVLLSVVSQVAVSLYGCLTGLFKPRFHEAVLLLTFVHLGQTLESKIRAYTTSNALSAMFRLQPRECMIVDAEGQTKSVELSTICPGDHVIIPSGTRFPVDGTLLSVGFESLSATAPAIAECDFSILTGESRPVAVTEGDHVWAGGVNLNLKPVVVRASTTGSDSQVASVLASVERALAKRSKTARLADKAADMLGKISVGIACAAAGLYSFLPPAILPQSLSGTGSAGAFLVSAAVLSSACPCGMALAIPMIAMVAISGAARRGILYRDGAALEMSGARRFAVVALDKTGTLTTGRLKVSEVRVKNSLSEKDVVGLLAALEMNTNHPVSDAIRRYAAERGYDLRLPRVVGRGTRVVPGLGIANDDVPLFPLGVDGVGPVQVGSSKWMQNIYNHRFEARRDFEDSSTVYVNCDALGGIIASIILVDEPRASEDDVAELRRIRGRPGLAVLSGDSQANVERTAKLLKIGSGFGDIVLGSQSPDEKAATVESMRSSRRGRICAVGDGVNDGPFLAKADIGFAMGSVPGGVANVAATAASVVLPNGDLALVSEALVIGRLSRWAAMLSLAWALVYNMLAFVRTTGLAGSANFLPAHRAALWMGFSSCISLSFPVVLGLTLELRRRQRMKRRRGILAHF